MGCDSRRAGMGAHGPLGRDHPGGRHQELRSLEIAKADLTPLQIKPDDKDAPRALLLKGDNVGNLRYEE